MSIEKSEKFVAVTTTYVQRTSPETARRAPADWISLIAIRGLAREPYTVVHERASWTTAVGLPCAPRPIVRQSSNYHQNGPTHAPPVAGESASRRLECMPDPLDP